MTRQPPDPGEAGSPEQSLDEALDRARRHAKNAVAEALAALRALLDAASLATSGAPAAEHPVLARADAWIRGAGEGIADTRGLPDELAAALAEALGAEIDRWEERARQDADARAVLRAFLGLREMLWEIGVRPGGAARGARRQPSAARDEHDSGPRPRRVERVAVEG